MNHESREMLRRIQILDDVKFPLSNVCKKHASIISLPRKFFVKTFASTRIDSIMVFGYFIGDTYCKTFVVHEYRADTF